MSNKTAMMKLIDAISKQHKHLLYTGQSDLAKPLEEIAMLAYKQLEEEKEQIINAWKDGLSFDDIPCSAEEYYKITYKQEDEIK